MSSSRRNTRPTESAAARPDSFDAKARQEFERYRQRAFHQSFGHGGDSPNPSPRPLSRPLSRHRYGGEGHVDEVPDAIWDSASDVEEESDAEHAGAYPYGAYAQSQYPPQHRMLSEDVGRETDTRGMLSSPFVSHYATYPLLTDYLHVSDYYYSQTPSSSATSSYAPSNYSTPPSSAASYGSYHSMEDNTQYSLGHGLGLAPGTASTQSYWQPSHREDGSATMQMRSSSSKPQPDTVIYIMESRW